MSALLSVEELHTYYGEAHILQGVSIEVGGGEVVTLIGRNGAGKTTTLRSIMGIAPPRRGHVRFRGDDVTHLGPHEIARRGIAWVPEERRVLPNLSVLENLRLGMLGGGVRDGAGLIDEVLAYFPRLRERIDSRGRFLSGGEQQMLAIARGLVARSTSRPRAWRRSSCRTSPRSSPRSTVAAPRSCSWSRLSRSPSRCPIACT